MAEVGTPIAESENVLIRAGECLVTVLPRFGGKIASIRLGSHELLQAPLSPIKTRTRTMSFDKADASGWDECLPSGAACSVSTTAGVAQIPDHGDLWRVAWERQGSQFRNSESEPKLNASSSLTLFGKCFSLPLEVERTIQLHKEKQKKRL